VHILDVIQRAHPAVGAHDPFQNCRAPSSCGRKSTSIASVAGVAALVMAGPRVAEPPGANSAVASGRSKRSGDAKPFPCGRRASPHFHDSQCAHDRCPTGQPARRSKLGDQLQPATFRRAIRPASVQISASQLRVTMIRTYMSTVANPADTFRCSLDVVSTFPRERLRGATDRSVVWRAPSWSDLSEISHRSRREARAMRGCVFSDAESGFGDWLRAARRRPASPRRSSAAYGSERPCARDLEQGRVGEARPATLGG